jgi:HEAT repeat protein
MGTSDISRPNEVESLIQALKDGDWEARRDAVRTLGKIGDARAVEPLTQVLKDQDRETQEAAKEALEKIKAKKSQE